MAYIDIPDNKPVVALFESIDESYTEEMYAKLLKRMLNEIKHFHDPARIVMEIKPVFDKLVKKYEDDEDETLEWVSRALEQGPKNP